MDRPPQRRAWPGHLARLLVSLAIGGIVVANVDVAGAIDLLSRIRVPALAAAALMMWVLVAIGACRWWLLTQPLPVSLRYVDALRYHAISVLFNQALPSTLGGDAVRLALMVREGHGAVPSIHSVVVDRVVALSGLLLLLVATAPLAYDTKFAWTSALVLLLGLVALGTAGLVARWLAPRFEGRVAEVMRATSALVDEPRWATIALAAGVLTFAWMSAIAWVLALGLGIEVPLVVFLALMPPVWLATSLPVSIGGWGVREGAMVAALALVAVPDDHALALSIAVGLIQIAGAVPGFALWMVRPRALPETP